MRIAGWIVDSDRPQHGHSLDTQVGEPKLRYGLLPTDGARHNRAASGTPAQGFHRSVSWSGPIGYVPGGLAEAPNRALITPVEDPAVFNGFTEADSIVELWQGTLGQGTLGQGTLGQGTLGQELVTPAAADLSAVDVDEPRTKLHSVPDAVLNPLLNTRVPASADRKQDIIPLTVPGRHQLKVDELPELRRSLALPPTATPLPPTATPQAPTATPQAPVATRQAPGAHAAHLESSLSEWSNPPQPVVSRITKALEGTSAQLEQQPLFSRTPLASEVRVNTVDKQLATTPLLELITQSPYRSGPRASTIPLKLPLTALPDLTSAQDVTLPNIDIYGEMRHELEITTPLRRLPSQV